MRLFFLSDREDLPLLLVSPGWSTEVGVGWVVSFLSPSSRYSLFPLSRVFFLKKLDMGPLFFSGGDVPLRFSFQPPLLEFPLPFDNPQSRGHPGLDLPIFTGLKV